MRITPKTTKSPTPTPTKMMSWVSSQPIWLAITFKSGSATVTRTPMMNVMRTISHIFRCLKSVPPTIVPIRVIERSAPAVKSERPRPITAAHIKKATKNGVVN